MREGILSARAGPATGPGRGQGGARGGGGLRTRNRAGPGQDQAHGSNRGRAQPRKLQGQVQGEIRAAQGPGPNQGIDGYKIKASTKINGKIIKFGARVGRDGIQA